MISLEYLCFMSDCIVCIGASLVDEIFYCNENAMEGTSNPAFSKRFAGGVMGNISRMLSQLGLPVKIISVIGNDTDGDWLKSELEISGLNTDLVLHSDQATGKYVSILQPDGSLFAAVCSDQTEVLLSPSYLESLSIALSAAKLIVADANLSLDSLAWLCDFSRNHAIPLILEPVSVIKARKFSKINLDQVLMITPNVEELQSVCPDCFQSTADSISHLLQSGLKQVWVRMGENGSMLKSLSDSITLDAIPTKPIDSTGAGDAALSGWVFGWNKGWSVYSCTKAGHVLAHATLGHKGAVVEYMDEKQFITLIQKIYPDVI